MTGAKAGNLYEILGVPREADAKAIYRTALGEQ